VGQNRIEPIRTETIVAPVGNPAFLAIALRVYPEGADPDPRPPKSWRRPGAMLVFDTETRVDAAQRLMFGCFRFIDDDECLSESLFYGSDLPKKDYKTLERYVFKHQESARRLRLLSLREFLYGQEDYSGLFRAVYKGRCLFVAFNHPFDLSRIAHDFTNARKRFAGGFSLGIWPDPRKTDREHRNQYRPRIAIKHIDSKRALIGFTKRKEPDEVDLIPEGSTTGTPEPDYIFRGHFLDLHTLAFALTDRNYSLETACEAFGVEHRKQRVARHGIVTKKYIDYNRRDVLATSELATKLLEEYDKHPISKSLQETKAYSPASIGKAYLRTMHIKPVLERQRKFPKCYLGYAQSAFFGGRTSAHIRKVAVPVVYTDFLSMYPTVNSLMNLWRFVTARKITVVKHCQAEIQAFLSRLTDDVLFKPEAWKKMTAFVRVIPNGDILPSRGRYSVESKDWQVAVNHLYAGSNNPDDAVWFSLPDIVASKVLYGRIPQIVDAFRIEAHGILGGLKSTQLRGAVNVDPRTQDFFRVAIEERIRLSRRTDLPEVEKDRLVKALKVLANAASYGIYAEMIRQEFEEKVNVTCHGIDEEPYLCRVAHPDVPGEYCFPPLASLITGAARLMLALLEHSVSRLGGTYAMEDTDSMAIVASKHGETILCPGGQQINAISWRQVQEISGQFASLNPYDRKAVPGSILKIEDDNFNPTTRRQRQLYCLAISAKRYALFMKDEKRAPVLLREGVNNSEDRWSEHGLGHLLNPTDPENEDRDWIAQVWRNIIRRALNLKTRNARFEHLPAIGRVTISSPAVMRPFAKLNEGKRYCDQIKPFNFLLTCHVKQLGHPPGTNPERFHLIAPYQSNPKQWLKMLWTEQYSGNTYGITTAGYHGNRHTARVKTYGDVLREYEFHPESKCADANGNPCDKQTIGLLQRRHVRIAEIKYIGKESNSLEEVEAGMIHSAQNVYTEYPDPRRDEWATKIQPALKKAPLKLLVKMSGMSRRALIDARAGRSRPHRINREKLVSILKKLGLI
jgi:DNA polymerase III epsilon subunit-like protein